MAKAIPYLNPANDRWTIDKDPEDKLYYVANVTAHLVDGATSTTSFEVLVQGVVLLEQGAPQGNLGGLLPVKLGGMGPANTDSYCTFRVTCANGEQFDKTIYLNRVSN